MCFLKEVSGKGRILRLASFDRPTEHLFELGKFLQAVHFMWKCKCHRLCFHSKHFFNNRTVYNSDVAGKCKFKKVAIPIFFHFVFRRENTTQSSECCLCQLYQVCTPHVQDPCFKVTPLKFVCLLSTVNEWLWVKGLPSVEKLIMVMNSYDTIINHYLFI